MVKCDEKLMNLTNIPLNLNPNIEVLLFTGTSQQSKNASLGRIFQNLANLQEITITFSNIPFIGDATFWPGINLIKLNLSFNQISMLSDKHFYNLTKLKILDLSYNHIMNVPTAVFQNLPNLTYLNLSNNRLTFLSPRTFHNLNKLKYLYLDYNLITNIKPEDLKGLGNLIKFSVRKCYLESLHSTVYYEINNIEYLDLSGNRFKYIKLNEFNFLKKLKVLDLHENQIQLTNDYSFLDHNLDLLDLSFNKLEDINECTFCNSTIKNLDLSNNQFKKIKSKFLSPLENHLIQLNMANNQNLNVKKMDNLISNLKKIENLNLANTNLDGSFSARKTFYYFYKNLKHLNLSNNNFINLTNELFPKFMKLISLDLSYNKIFSLSETSVKNLAKLIKENKNLTQLYIHGNPFRCYTCHIWPIRDLLKMNPKAYFNQCNKNDEFCVKCKYPKDVNGNRIDLIDESKIRFCSDPSIFQRLYTSEPRVGLILTLIIIFSILIIIILIVIKYRQKSAVYYTNEDKLNESTLFTIQQVAKATAFSPSLTSPTASSPTVSRLNLNDIDGLIPKSQTNHKLHEYLQEQQQQQEQQQSTYNNNNSLLSRVNSIENHQNYPNVTIYTTNNLLTQPISEHLIYTSVSSINSQPIYSIKNNLPSPYTISVISNVNDI